LQLKVQVILAVMSGEGKREGERKGIFFNILKNNILML
jgi:hypothetical protein